MSETPNQQDQDAALFENIFVTIPRKKLPPNLVDKINKIIYGKIASEPLPDNMIEFNKKYKFLGKGHQIEVVNLLVASRELLKRNTNCMASQEMVHLIGLFMEKVGYDDSQR